MGVLLHGDMVFTATEKCIVLLSHQSTTTIIQVDQPIVKLFTLTSNQLLGLGTKGAIFKFKIGLKQKVQVEKVFDLSEIVSCAALSDNKLAIGTTTGLVYVYDV